MSRNYWGYRIDTNNIEFFKNELMDGRLRQGWGYEESHNLKNPQTVLIDEGARRNLAMFRVKKGDILLIPQLPDWGYVTIAEATDDFESAYRFNISHQHSDYGHIFPAVKRMDFIPSSKSVQSNIRSTLGCRSRFWSINHCAEAVDEILSAGQATAVEPFSAVERTEHVLQSTFDSIFCENNFSNELYKKMNEQFGASGWEYALVHGLKIRFPYYQVERVGGTEEAKHGTDILIKMPSILKDYEYAVAIQVKDYEGYVGEDVIAQINKADTYAEWNGDNVKLVDKFVILTRADKESNLHLLQNSNGVRFIFANDLKQILSEIGRHFIGISG